MAVAATMMCSCPTVPSGVAKLMIVVETDQPLALNGNDCAPTGAVANLLVLVVRLESQLARIHLDQLGAHRHLPFGVAPKCLTCASKTTVVCPSGKISLDAGTLHKGDHRWRGQHTVASQQSGVSKCPIWVTSCPAEDDRFGINADVVFVDAPASSGAVPSESLRVSGLRTGRPLERLR